MAHVGWGNMTALGIVYQNAGRAWHLLRLYFIRECSIHHFSIQQIIQIVCSTTLLRYKNAFQFRNSACHASHRIADSDKASAAWQAVIGVCATFVHDCKTQWADWYKRLPSALSLSHFSLPSHLNLTSPSFMNYIRRDPKSRAKNNRQ